MTGYLFKKNPILLKDTTYNKVAKLAKTILGWRET